MSEQLRTAAQQALAFIKTTNASSSFWLVPESNLNKTVKALRAALEQPEQEPVAWCNCEPTLCDGVGRCRWQAMNYTHPPRREWRGLTDEVIADLWHQNGGFHHHFARAVERWLKGKDHA